MKKRIAPDYIDFNKELLFAEIGSVIFAPSIAFIVSRFTSAPNTISSFAVIGALLGSCLFWLITRIYDQKKIHNFTAKKLFRDLLYFTPVAFIIAMLIYYPSLFLTSRYFLRQGDRAIYAVIGAQAIAFLAFLAAVNFYKYFLFRTIGKKL
jgi:hypothetical protein